MTTAWSPQLRMERAAAMTIDNVTDFAEKHRLRGSTCRVRRIDV
jgi:hypothetical protein